MSTKNSILSLADAKALVHVEGRDTYATSRELADHLGKRHANVLKKIDGLTEETFSQLQMESAEYLDEQGKQRKEYRLNRDAVAFLIPRFTGAKSEEWHMKYIAAFNLMEAHLRKLYANPPRSDILRDKRKAHNPMMDALIEAREELGKATGGVHYMSENKLCNGVVTGKYSKIDETALSNEDALLLSVVRNINESYLLEGLDYKTRKAKLQDFTMNRRTKRLTTKV